MNKEREKQVRTAIRWVSISPRCGPPMNYLYVGQFRFGSIHLNVGGKQEAHVHLGGRTYSLCFTDEAEGRAWMESKLIEIFGQLFFTLEGGTNGTKVPEPAVSH